MEIPLYSKRDRTFLNSAPTSTESALRLLNAPSVCLVEQLKCLCKIFTKFAANLHTHTRCSSSSFIVSSSIIRRTACARAQFSGCSSTTNAHSETGQMAVCCQNLTLGVLSSCSALSMLVGALFKMFGLFFNTNPLKRAHKVMSERRALGQYLEPHMCS
jgi:hypothetical protein